MKKLVLLLFLVACQFSPPTKMPELPDINTGTSGVEVSFQSMPELLMCQQADFVVKLHNAGSAKAEGVYNFIIEEQTLKILSPKTGKLLFDGRPLNGRSLINPVGDYDQIVLRVESALLEEKIESYQTPVIFQACYDYETVASVPVCIDPDVRNVNKDKACVVQSVALSGGQGAPVAITSVETFMAPVGNQVQPRFIIHMQNLGSGSVVGMSVEDAKGRVNVPELACKGGAGRLANVVHIDAELQGVKLFCKPPVIALKPDADTEVSCISSELSYGLAEGTFSSVLTIKLTYGYINTANLPVTINRLPGQIDCKRDK